MAEIAYILGPPGGGKTVGIINPPDGECTPEYIAGWPDSYNGIDPKTTVIFNCDGKRLNFPYQKIGFIEGENLFTSTYEKPLTADKMLDIKSGNSTKPGLIRWVNDKRPDVKRIIIDTINGAMNDKEMLEIRNLTWDQWYVFAKDFYALNVMSYSLRPDLIVYIFGHIDLETDVDGNQFKCLLTSGKRLGKIGLESKSNNVYFTKITGTGENAEYRFETTANQSTGRSPIGMYEDILIPNSLKLVDERVRKYYGI